MLNFSVLDGWWREGYNGKNGWAIGEDKDYQDSNQQDEADAKSLYDTLENEIIPLYYQNALRMGCPGIGSPDEGLHPHPGAAVQHASHGERISGAHVPACHAVNNNPIILERG